MPSPTVVQGNGKIGVKTTNSGASRFLSLAAHLGTHPLALVDVLKKNICKG